MPKREFTTILGIDFGSKRLGIALGNTITGTARPLTTINYTSDKPAWDEILALITEWGCEAVVVGIPYNQDGSTGKMATATNEFIKELQININLPVLYVDERYTSQAAKSDLRRGHDSTADKDSYAAKLILESWLRQQ